jgi:general stress protein YciG
MNAKPKQKRGFAAMSPEKQRMIASKGGKSVPAEKRYYANKANASAAGFKGGSSPRRRKVRNASV